MNEDGKTQAEQQHQDHQADSRGEHQNSETDMAASETDAGQADALAALEVELQETRDRLMRAVAETENVRRRAEREKTDALAYGATAFARDMLDVADNLRRALDAVPAELRANETLASLVTGVEMTERSLLHAFEKHGIAKIEAKGEKFDPNRHQAMFEVETGDVPAGHVVDVMQPGYVIKDRLLRPAMVGVAKAAQAPKSGVDETI
ncbi:MAG: nucleotide exchange factor GrpE [Sphingomonadales bacterium]